MTNQLIRPLSPLQNFLFRLGGILLLVAVAQPLFLDDMTQYCCIVFGIGALLFVTMQMLMRYEGHDVTLRHLRRQQIAGGIFLLIAAMLWIGKVYHVGPLRGDEWKLALGIAAVFEVYTAFRIPYVIDKEGKR